MTEGKLDRFLMGDPISLEHFCESAPRSCIAAAGSLLGSLSREDNGQER